MGSQSGVTATTQDCDCDVAPEADVVIVGAGPAGLAAGAACRAAGVRTIVLERGKRAGDRDRRAAGDIASGIGGAGLFSDGKFSFYPSASNLWTLQPRDALRTAYEWTSRLIKPYGIEAPPFPDREADIPDADCNDCNGFRKKDYPSYRMHLEKRLELVTELRDSAGTVYTGAEAIHIRSEDGRVAVTTRVQAPGSRLERNTVASGIVVATGRLGAIRLLRWLNGAHSVFRRIEVGVRLEQPEASFFLREARGLDPKLIGSDLRGLEWRTFCCCRGGEVVEVLSDGILGVSGRSDIKSTNLSNVAFHVRITDPAVGARLCGPMLSKLEHQSGSFLLEVENIQRDPKLMDILRQFFGAEVAKRISWLTFSAKLASSSMA